MAMRVGSGWFRDDFELLFEFSGVIHAGLADVDGFGFDRLDAVEAPAGGNHVVDEVGFEFVFRFPEFVVGFSSGFKKFGLSLASIPLRRPASILAWDGMFTAPFLILV